MASQICLQLNKLCPIMKLPSVLEASRPILAPVHARLMSNSTKSPSESGEPWIPVYEEREHEPLQLKRSRLVYQSRKRGMLENGLLLSTFAAKHLNTMSEQHLQQYDRLINLPSNDWDIFYWATGVKPTPAEFETEVMGMLKDHVKNKNREVRLVQPALY